MYKKILIITGSKNDFPHLSEMVNIFRQLEIDFFVRTISCHRNLKELVLYLDQINEEEIGVIIGVSHSVSNLPAIIAGYIKNKTIPVIGVGLGDTKLNGLDSLLSVNSIPKNVPLLNTGIGQVGLYNAVISAARILAMNNNELKNRLRDFFNK